MNVRRICRLCYLSVASLFWTSCDSESDLQTTAPEIPDPDSATPDDAGKSSDGQSLSSSEEASALSASSAEAAGPVESSAEKAESASSDASSSSSPAEYFLARDPSVTCEIGYYSVPACTSTRGLSCDDYKKYLSSDTTLSQKLLTDWEEKLQNCDAIMAPVPVYGVSYDPCSASFYQATLMKCTNDSTYRSFVLDGKLVYANADEYNGMKGISSAVESSSSAAEDLVKNCPQGDYALFADILADVQKELYGEIVEMLDVADMFGAESSLTEGGREYLEGLLDHEKKTLKGKFAPYLDGSDEDYPLMETSLSWKTKAWFSGYVAKTRTCEDGTPVMTQRYRDQHDAIYEDCLENIYDNAGLAYLAP